MLQFFDTPNLYLISEIGKIVKFLYKMTVFNISSIKGHSNIKEVMNFKFLRQQMNQADDKISKTSKNYYKLSESDNKICNLI